MPDTVLDISEVRKRVRQVLDAARRAATDRRLRADEATRQFDEFLAQTAVPVTRLFAQALKAEGHSFQAFTPAGAVRLASDRFPDDYIELGLDVTGDTPVVVGRINYTRGRKLISLEQPIKGTTPVAELREHDVLEFLAAAIERFVERA